MKQTSFTLSAALSFLVGGCSADTKSISVILNLDEQSCQATESELTLSCTSTSVVTVYSSDDQIITQDCVPVSVGPLQNLPHSLQGALSLGSLPTNRPIRIDLSVYNGGFACSDLPGVLGNAPPYLFATTSLLTLSDSSSDIALSLQCAQDGNSTNGQDCDDCYRQSLDCFQINDLTRCDSVISRCVADCSPADPQCQQSCELLRSFCDDVADDAVELRCDLENNDCPLSCPDEGGACGQDCVFASEYCETRDAILTACYDKETECRGYCLAPDCLDYL